MAQCVKHLPPNHEDLSSNPQNPWDTRSSSLHLWSQFSYGEVRDTDKKIPQEACKQLA